MKNLGAEVPAAVESEGATICVASYDDIFTERAVAALSSMYRVGHTAPEREALLQSLRAMQPDLCIIDVDEAGWGGARGLDALALVRGAIGDKPIVVVSEDLHSELVIQAFRAGAADVCSKAIVEQELPELLRRLLKPRGRWQVSEGGRSTLIAGMMPGTGTGTFARMLAGELRASKDRPVLLIDLTGREIGPAELERSRPIYTVAEAISDIGRVDEALVESAFTRLEGYDVHLLSALPGTRVGAEVRPQDIATLVEVLKGYFAEILITPPSSIELPALLRMCGDADEVVLCVDQRVPNLKRCAHFLSALEKPSPGHAAKLVVTRYTGALHPSASEIAETLRINRFATIPEDRATVEMALNAGMPLTGTRRRSRLARSVKAAARMLEQGGGAISSRNGGPDRLPRVSWLGRLRRDWGFSLRSGYRA